MFVVASGRRILVADVGRGCGGLATRQSMKCKLNVALAATLSCCAKLCTTFIVLAVFTTTGARANLLTNGSFEAGTLQGWSASSLWVTNSTVFSPRPDGSVIALDTCG